MPQLITSVEGVEIHHIYLQRERTTLGRRPDNDIVLADLAVSGAHCAFELRGLSDVYVQDLDSTNGTYINGQMVKRHLLTDGDEITIGKFKIQYLRANELTDESRTLDMPLGSDQMPLAAAPVKASLKVMSGSSTGLVVPVYKAVSTFGKPGVTMIAIAHRRHGYFVSEMESQIHPTINGQRLPPDAVQLIDGDILELAGTRLEFSLQSA
jgi:pSer/pThr/pTyr-binding forkhead associated (FHA) protein